MKNIVFVLAMLPVLCFGQFSSKFGVLLGAGGGKAYGAGITASNWSSDIRTGAFLDWSDNYFGFKTSGVWTTYEGSKFKDGVFALEFLPRAIHPRTGLWAGCGIFTVLNAKSTESSKSGIGLMSEVGWSAGRVLVSLGLRHTFFDVSTELSGRQKVFELGARVYYSLISN